MLKIDWQKYNDLCKKDFKDMTEDEKEFFKFMYHCEECRLEHDEV